jgi:hypothetical protein
MMKLSWLVVCCLVIFNVTLLYMGNSEQDLIGANCNPNSCTSASFMFYECHHWANDPDGAPCNSKQCIYNGITHSYCASGENECKFKYDANEQLAYQSIRSVTNCPSAATVHWNKHSNTDPCDGIQEYETACETTSCGGTELRSSRRYGRNVCDTSN